MVIMQIIGFLTLLHPPPVRKMTENTGSYRKKQKAESNHIFYEIFLRVQYRKQNCRKSVRLKSMNRVQAANFNAVYSSSVRNTDDRVKIGSSIYG